MIQQLEDILADLETAGMTNKARLLREYILSLEARVQLPHIAGLEAKIQLLTESETALKAQVEQLAAWRSGEPLPNPLQLSFGTGRIFIGHFKNDTGAGVYFADSGEEHPIGRAVKSIPRPTKASKGEVYLHFTNAASARVLHEMLSEVIYDLDPAHPDADIRRFLCVFDPRHPDYADEVAKAEGCQLRLPRQSCWCNNCENGADQLAVEILRLRGAKTPERGEVVI